MTAPGTYDYALSIMRTVMRDGAPRMVRRRAWEKGKALRGVRAGPPHEYAMTFELRAHHKPGIEDTWVKGGGHLPREDRIARDWETTA